ncbi:heme biosynthesis HemY N-terminal domain-containing protein [Guyparkeria sp.]|uniref:heme biosynthesis HemY N-terminal domain-containing protein n=1 Tax=Guyparkeria sp. TaxID=2035736 RepID=UPI0039707A6F
MKRVIFWILVLAALVAAGVYFLPGAGAAMVEFAGWRLETTALGLVLIAVAALVALLLVWRVLAGIFHLPRRWARRSADKRRRTADEKLLRAWAERQRRHSDEAQRYALAGVEDGSLPPLHFQVAIDALLDGFDPSRQGVATQSREDSRKEINDLFETVARRFPKFAEFLRLHIVQRLMSLSEIEWARELVEPLTETHPRDEAILLIRAQLLEHAGDWDALAKLLPTLRRIKSNRLTGDELLRLERTVLLGRMEAAARRRDLDVLSRLWAEAGHNVTQNAGVTIAYARALQRSNAGPAATEVLEKRLSRHRDAATLHAWADLDHSDPAEARKRLKRLVPEEWNEPANAPDVAHAGERSAFAYAMAKLALEEGDPSAAQLWIGRLGQLDQDVRYLAIAARVHARLRDSTEASLLYERALARAGMEAGMTAADGR